MVARYILDADRINRITDSSARSCTSAMLEPEVIGRLMPDAPAERVEVHLADLQPYLVKGLLATEDRFFYYHSGFDPIRIVEATRDRSRRRHRLEQGASTITQQLARTFIPPQRRSFRRKFRELAVALVLEIQLSKDGFWNATSTTCRWANIMARRSTGCRSRRVISSTRTCAK